MCGQMTGKESLGKFRSGPVSEPAFSEKRTGGFAEASYWVKQCYFSSLAIPLWRCWVIFQLLSVLVFFYTNEIICYLMDLI